MKRVILFFCLIILSTSCFDNKFDEFMGWSDIDQIEINNTINENKPSGNEKSIQGNFPTASKRPLTNQELLSNTYNTYDLKIMRNEIFARHGYIFEKGGDTDSYFRNQDWYIPRFNNVDNSLTDIEKKNIILIKQAEESLANIKDDFIPDNSEQLEEAVGYGTIMVENLRLRDTPYLNGETITLLKKDSFVNVDEVSIFKTTIELNGNQISDVWYKITTNDNNVGWVHGCCIEVTFP